MAVESGRAFLLKIGDGASPIENFTTLAGLRSTRISVNNEMIDITNKESNGWRQLLADGGIRTVSVSGAGIFTNSQSEKDTQNHALSGAINNYEIVFESGDKFSGAFLVSALEYSGEHKGERTYSFNLESSGEIIFNGV